jgi:hypothetical protein
LVAALGIEIDDVQLMKAIDTGVVRQEVSQHTAE